MFSEFFEYYELMFNSHQLLLLKLMKAKFKAMKCCLNDENTDHFCFNKDLKPLIGLKDLYEKETISDDDFEQSDSSNSDSESSI